MWGGGACAVSSTGVSYARWMLTPPHSYIGAKPNYIIGDEGTSITDKAWNSYFGPVSDGADGPTICVSSAKISDTNHFMNMVRNATRARQRTIDARLDPENAHIPWDELRDPQDTADVIVLELECHLCTHEGIPCTHRDHLKSPFTTSSGARNIFYTNQKAYEQEHLNKTDVDSSPAFPVESVNRLFLTPSRFVSHASISHLRHFVVTIDPSGGSLHKSETAIVAVAYLQCRPVLIGGDCRITPDTADVCVLVEQFISALVKRFYLPSFHVSSLASDTASVSSLATHTPSSSHTSHPVPHVTSSPYTHTSLLDDVNDSLGDGEFHCPASHKGTGIAGTPVEIMLVCENNTAFAPNDVTKHAMTRFRGRKDVLLHCPATLRTTPYTGTYVTEPTIKYGVRTDNRRKIRFRNAIHSTIATTESLLLAQAPVHAAAPLHCNNPGNSVVRLPTPRPHVFGPNNTLLTSIDVLSRVMSRNGAMGENINNFMASIGGVSSETLGRYGTLSSEQITSIFQMREVLQRAPLHTMAFYAKLWDQLARARRVYTPSGEETYNAKDGQDDIFIDLGFALVEAEDVLGNNSIPYSFRKAFYVAGGLPPPPAEFEHHAPGRMLPDV